MQPYILLLTTLILLPARTEAQVVIPQQGQTEAPSAPAKPAPAAPAPQAQNFTPAPAATPASPPAWERLLNPRGDRKAGEIVSQQEIEAVQRQRSAIMKKLGLPETNYSPFGEVTSQSYQLPPGYESGKIATGNIKFSFKVTAAPKFGPNDQKAVKAMAGWEGQDIFKQCRMEHSIFFRAGGYIWPVTMNGSNTAGQATFTGIPEQAEIMLMLNCDAGGTFPDYKKTTYREVSGYQIPILPPPDVRGPTFNGRRYIFVARTTCDTPEALRKNPNLSEIELAYAYEGDREVTCNFR